MADAESFIKKLFNDLVDPASPHVQFLVEHNRGDSGVEKWQHTKMKEIAEKTVSGLTVTTDGQRVAYEINYTIGFPNDWDRGDVVDWVVEQGPGEMPKAHIFNFIENHIKNKGVGGGTKDPQYIAEKKVVESLMRTLKVKKIEKSK
jgi:hypothetical protein